MNEAHRANIYDWLLKIKAAARDKRIAAQKDEGESREKELADAWANLTEYARVDLGPELSSLMIPAERPVGFGTLLKHSWELTLALPAHTRIYAKYIQWHNGGWVRGVSFLGGNSMMPYWDVEGIESGRSVTAKHDLGDALLVAEEEAEKRVKMEAEIGETAKIIQSRPSWKERFRELMAELMGDCVETE